MHRPTRRELFRSAVCATLTLVAVAAAATQISADQRKLLEQKFPGVTIGEINSTPVAGWAEIWLDGEPMYVSTDGRYLMNGRLLEIDTKTDLTRIAKARVRAKEIAALDERDLVIYSPPLPKHEVTVFTDVSCEHCRQIQRDLSTLTGLGVKVRLIALPRHGPKSEAWRAMELAWCDSDRKSALERIMTEGSAALLDPSRQACMPNLVAQHYALAQRLHIAGTPTIIAPNGDILGGYLPPDELVRRLEAL
jgi:thiol:disulfide interchange protein DsbC